MKTMVCHGDSLTEGADLDKSYTWPQLVENRVRVTVLNKGIGGDTSGGLLARFQQDVVQNKPDLVVILGGTNDLWWDLDINLILANIFAMACQAQHRDIAPVVGLPLPLFMENIRNQNMMAPIAGWDRYINKLSELVNALAVAAKESEIACLDFYHLFLDTNQKVRGDFFLEDGLHPNKQGHRLMAEKMSELLQNLFCFS
ncbi:MAG: GDSL-type esterase/lipase family protein [Desulfobacterales bacterium]|jgi:lysophospholipase L1-like esterase